MPLHKLPPQGPSSNDSHASKRRQTQDRRRTLQTISELTTTDGTPPDFISFITAKRGEDNQRITNKTNKTRKRQSLPQYCPSPACAQAQAAITGPPLRNAVSHHSLQGCSREAQDLSRCEAGWNARRDRARAQREQAVMGVNDPHVTFDRSVQDGNLYQPLSNSHRLASRPSQSSLMSYSTQQQLLRNSRSISGFSQTNDAETSGRASTDSSSFHSSRDSVVRRSRSGSSSDRSFASSRTTPPLPIASPPPIPRYYTSPISYNQYMPPVPRSKTPKQQRPTAGYRSSSLPTIRIDRPRSAPYDREHNMARTSTLPAYQRHQVDIQRARLESLAALTASPPTPSTTHPNRPSSLQHHHRLSLPAPHAQHPSTSHRPRPRSTHRSAPHSRPPRQSTNQSIIYNQNPDKIGLRTVPKRESLTQWKAERDNAQAGREYMQRAKMMERVRRANEMEREREKELLAMVMENDAEVLVVVGEKMDEGGGKREVKWGKGEESGCLGGLMRMFGGRGG
ncbi:hypothetical protein T440DRAFT_519684 [Plenodomus tracheiphilus IPT5]|uniref:Uncharacterized protein n=1 Tax=Plenodomus tracheiphilus IPT5 TaxID=1408161 RepID=A0A6A7B359_9PLEO|nr:hypothetical protein T440DRAFT_519684 [Plenodomus tracheiphilus IPT5]